MRRSAAISGARSGRCFLGWVVDAFDFNILAFILIDIQKSFTVDRALAGALGTVTLVMRLLGGAAAGTLADKYGRKLPLMLSVVWFSLFAFLSGFLTSYAMLFAPACRAWPCGWPDHASQSASDRAERRRGVKRAMRAKTLSCERRTAPRSSAHCATWASGVETLRRLACSRRRSSPTRIQWSMGVSCRGISWS